MAIYLIVWVSCSILSPLIPAVGTVKCTEKETLLREMPTMLVLPTNCLLECTALIFTQKQQLQDKRNIRLKDSTRGDLGEYCWSMPLTCTIGERFHHAFVVLPYDMSSAGQEQLELKSTSPTAATLSAPDGSITLGHNCGPRYDVTQHVDTEQSGPAFCVQVFTQQGLLVENALRCPPFLVTFWQRGPNQSKNGEGG